MTADIAQVRLKDSPIGFASGLAIRFVFLREIEWSPAHRKRKGIEKIEDREMQLRDLQRIIEGGDEQMKAICGPIQSFYRDITLTEEGARRLPIVAACSASKRDEIRGNAENVAPVVNVRIPGVIWSEWEGELVDIQIVEGPRPPAPKPNEQYLPPIDLSCDFADTMAFFGSGHVAYSFSILFRPDSVLTTGSRDGGDIPVNPAVILSLLDLARFNSRPSRKRPNIRFGFWDDPTGLKEIDDFVFQRICSLANESRPGHVDSCDVFRGIVWPLRKDKGWTEPKTGDEADFASFKYADLQSATCEIVGFTEFERLEKSVNEAKGYRAEADSFGKALAGLAQNVLDFEDQDSHEVSDSLIAAGSVGGYLHFINAKAIVRFYRRSRSFERMQHFVGGDPYFFFTTMAAIYNEFLTNQAEQALSELKPGLLIEASPFDSTRNELEGRYRIFSAHLRPIIPNLFRYHTEAALFDHILERRGIAAKRAMIEKELSHYETIAHDFENLNLQRSNMRINLLIIILALWSAFGALVAAASLFVALHSDVQPEKVSELAVDFVKGFVEQFTETSFWVALAGLVVAASFSLFFLVQGLVSSARQYRLQRSKHDSEAA